MLPTLLLQTLLQTLGQKMLASDKLLLLFGLNPLPNIVNSVLTVTKKVLCTSFTEFKPLLRQFTSITVVQLEGCKLPPSGLTGGLILSTGADPPTILFKYDFIFYISQLIQNYRINLTNHFWIR
jgi:hypothetical protein